MTIRVDDDLGQETPDDPEFDFESQIEFIVTIEANEANEAESLPEVVDATDNLIIDDGEPEFVEEDPDDEVEVELRPDHEAELEYETIFVSETDEAQAEPVEPAPVTDQVAETPVDERATNDATQGLVEESTLEVFPATEVAGNTWSFSRASAVAIPAMAAVLALGSVGYAFGRIGGSEEIVRREFVYTLDESVPDSFLREDRRLLTQIVTIESDSVLSPVAEEFDLSTEDLRDKIEVETVDLSEVLRLEVTDESRTTALAISEAVIEQYLVVSSNPLPSDRSSALLTQRDDVVEELATADAALLALQQGKREDAQLATQEESLQRQIDLTTEHINRLEGLIEDSLVSTLSASRRNKLETEKATAELELVDLETQLGRVRTERAKLTERSAAELTLGREVGRLESDLKTIEDELARRELGPLVASPVRALSEPSLVTVTAHRAGLTGLAGGVLLGIPLAALVACRIRKRQLWLD